MVTVSATTYSSVMASNEDLERRVAALETEMADVRTLAQAPTRTHPGSMRQCVARSAS